MASQQVAPPTVQHAETEQAGSVKEIVGTWHALPLGIVLQFNGDGSARFGLDWDGTTIGQEAQIEFENRELSIRFKNYDGLNEVCAYATGHYAVQLHQDGNISFEPIQDDCQTRVDVLSGPEEAGFRLMYHSVHHVDTLP